MVPATPNTTREVTSQRQLTPVHACYLRLFGEPDDRAAAEMHAVAAYLPASPSPELILLVAVATHHRCAERAADDALARRQAQLQSQIDTLSATVVWIERRRELRYAIIQLVLSVGVLLGALYLAAQALGEHNGRVVAVMQCSLALVAATVGVRMLWRPR